MHYSRHRREVVGSAISEFIIGKRHGRETENSHFGGILKTHFPQLAFGDLMHAGIPYLDPHPTPLFQA